MVVSPTPNDISKPKYHSLSEVLSHATTHRKFTYRVTAFL